MTLVHAAVATHQRGDAALTPPVPVRPPPSEDLRGPIPVHRPDPDHPVLAPGLAPGPNRVPERQAPRGAMRTATRLTAEAAPPQSLPLPVKMVGRARSVPGPGHPPPERPRPR